MYLYIQCFWGKLNHVKKIRNYLKKISPNKSANRRID